MEVSRGLCACFRQSWCDEFKPKWWIQNCSLWRSHLYPPGAQVWRQRTDSRGRSSVLFQRKGWSIAGDAEGEGSVDGGMLRRGPCWADEGSEGWGVGTVESEAWKLSELGPVCAPSRERQLPHPSSLPRRQGDRGHAGDTGSALGSNLHFINP